MSLCNCMTCATARGEPTCDASIKPCPLRIPMPFGGWFVVKPPRPLTEDDKALHRAISQSSNDGKRYGVGQYVNETHG